MVFLDTNVVSEMLRPRPDPAVQNWTDRVPERELVIAATTSAELLMGVEFMPKGARRDRLANLVEETLAQIPIVPFDATAAKHYAEIVATRRRAGRPISAFDAQIAATARAHHAAIATRDTAGFTGCGVEIVNPWNA